MCEDKPFAFYHCQNVASAVLLLSAVSAQLQVLYSAFSPEWHPDVSAEERKMLAKEASFHFYYFKIKLP